VRIAVLAVLTAAFCACGTTKTSYINRDVYTVAVLMPDDHSDYLPAAEKCWAMIEHEVARRGYRLVPRPTVQAFYKAKNFTVGGEIEQYTPQELAQEFKCDGLVYSQVDHWGTVNMVVYTELKVALTAALRDGRDGQSLWQDEGSDAKKMVATNLKDAANQTKDSLKASLEPQAERAAQACFATLPLPGFEPKEQPK
jgi:hypothetical protein